MKQPCHGADSPAGPPLQVGRGMTGRTVQPVLPCRRARNDGADSPTGPPLQLHPLLFTAAAASHDGPAPPCAACNSSRLHAPTPQRQHPSTPLVSTRTFAHPAESAPASPAARRSSRAAEARGPAGSRTAAGRPGSPGRREAAAAPSTPRALMPTRAALLQYNRCRAQGYLCIPPNR